MGLGLLCTESVFQVCGIPLPTWCPRGASGALGGRHLLPLACHTEGIAASLLPSVWLTDRLDASVLNSLLVFHVDQGASDLPARGDGDAGREAD